MYLRLSWKDERLTELFSEEEKSDSKFMVLEVPSHVSSVGFY